MKIAVTFENEQVYQHFGHTSQFKLYEVADGKIVSSTILDTQGSGHGALAGFLKGAGADAVICGGIGAGAQAALAGAGIQLYGGVSGSCDDAVAALLAGTLAWSADATCTHHGGHHHGEGHSCGSHGCGSHSCH
ncbi:MAG: dinitrogenase iron-molybdenum cofactor biosynthesis protein [Clostridiaceae bacterium]|nr:dinitrogenase iron-molybdenum cofactor biosynthesis protein [Clostridiaceae bacterium]